MPSSQAQSVPSTPLKPNQAFQLPIIEDWQLPQRYRRRALDAEEIDYINVSRSYKYYCYSCY